MSYLIIHVVRRFSMRGGMEKYVWNLVHGLSHSGLAVGVICQSYDVGVDPKISVFTVEELPLENSSYKQLLAFNDAVLKSLRANFGGIPLIVHSHERCTFHQITTFHTLPFSVAPDSFFRFLSPRTQAWLNMEFAELFSESVRFVIPVSELLMKLLINRYPNLTSKKNLRVGYPGVFGQDSIRSQNATKVYKMVFVGKEWKRKGLRQAIKILGSLRAAGFDVELDVFGVLELQVPRSMRAIHGVTYMGWVDSVPWEKYDLLVHLARSEAFGMVVAEARAAGLSVLTYSHVGAVGLGFSQMLIAEPREKICELANRVKPHILNRNCSTGQILWSWENLVSMHVQEIYPQVKPVFFGS